MSEYKVKYTVGGWLVGSKNVKIIKANNGKEAIKIAEEEHMEDHFFDRGYSFEINDIEKL